MLDILNNILKIPGMSLCGTSLGGACSPLSNAIDPLTSVTNQINPFNSIQNINPFSSAKTTRSAPCEDGFLSFFTKATADKGSWCMPTIQEWAEIESWLNEMNDLADAGHVVLYCMLEMLCECKPDITVYVKYDNPHAFAATKPQGNYKYDMYFDMNNMKNLALAKSKEYITQVFENELNWDLTINQTSIGYFPINPNEHYFISNLVHELGHIIDHLYYTQTYYGTQLHPYMWQSFYHLGFYDMNVMTPPKFFGDFRYLNLPEHVNCDEIKKALESYAPDFTIPPPK